MRNKNKIGTLSMLLLGLLMNGSLFAQPCATPSNVTASPSTICPSGTSQLNAISTGNTIDWYTQAIGGVAIGSSASGANFAVTPSVNTTYYAEAINTGGSSGTQTFSYTGAAQTFTVPPGVVRSTLICKVLKVELDTICRLLRLVWADVCKEPSQRRPVRFCRSMSAVKVALAAQP
jgi:hypothetical protein